jgi:two-component system LytT family response regulator
MSITALIVDDEVLGRERISRLLTNHPDVTVMGACSNGADAISAVQRHPPDLLFLDVEMRDVDGFDVLASVGTDIARTTVFVTAYDKYAIRAFEVDALDYLLKPFDEERFDQTMARVRRRLAGGEGTAEGGAPWLPDGELRGPYVERLMVQEAGRLFFIKVESVDWFESTDNYIRVHQAEHTYQIRGSLALMLETLDPKNFARIHRSAIVNLDRIKHMEARFAGDYLLVLETGVELKVSRNYNGFIKAGLRALREDRRT